MNYSETERYHFNVENLGCFCVIYLPETIIYIEIARKKTTSEEEEKEFININ